MSIEKDIADQMLNAMVGASITSDIEDITVPISEQLRVLRKINELPTDSKKLIVKLIIDNGYIHLFGDAPTGVTINLNKLPNELITMLYKKMLEYS